MSQENQLHKIIKQAERVRKQNQTSCQELQGWLDFQLSEINGKINSKFPCTPSYGKFKHNGNKQFQQAFRTLSKIQQAKYYLMSTKNIEKFYNGGDSNNQKKLTLKLIAEIINPNLFGSNKFVTLSLDYVNKTITFQQCRRRTLSLGNFLLRKSNNTKQGGLVFEPINSKAYWPTTRFFFSSPQFQTNYKLIKELWQLSHYDNIKQILLRHQKIQNQEIQKCGYLTLRTRKQSKTSRATAETQGDPEPCHTDLANSKQIPKQKINIQTTVQDDFQREKVSQTNKSQLFQFYTITDNEQRGYQNYDLSYQRTSKTDKVIQNCMSPRNLQQHKVPYNQATQNYQNKHISSRSDMQDSFRQEKNKVKFDELIFDKNNIILLAAKLNLQKKCNKAN